MSQLGHSLPKFSTPVPTNVRFAPLATKMVRHGECPLSAMCGRLRVGKNFLHVCSLGRCSHVFGLLARHTWPLAIMPSADQVPVKSTHSTMRWHKWVVLIAGSTGSALRAVRPFQPSHHAGCPARSRLRRKRDGFFVALAPGHHRPGHPRNLVGKCAGHEQAAQIAVTLLADTAEPVLAPA